MLGEVHLTPKGSPMAQQRRSPPQQQRTQQRPAPQQHRPAPAPITTTHRSAVDALLAEDDVSIVKPDAAALESITKSEVAMQLDAAHRWPRSIARFLEDATALATMNKATAQSCMYTLPVRKGGIEPITGPSVRLAEMCATSWGNLHTGARIIDESRATVTAQALAWDLEKNLRLSIEVKRGILTSDGRRYGEDMIRVTSMAAISIALRNAIFRIIPRALIDHVYEASKIVATGQADNTFVKERDAVMNWFVNRKGVEPARIFARLGIANIAEMTPDHLAALIGWGSAIKNNEATPEEIFSPPAAAAAAQPTRSKGAALDALANAHKKSDPPPANDAPPADDLPLTPELVHQALADADEAWVPGHLLATVKGWSPADQRIAYNWAVAFMDTPNDQAPPEQPEFTVLPREMGQEG